MRVSTTLGHLDHHVGVLLRSTPVTAARHGVLGVVHDHLEGDTPLLAAQFHEACVPLLELLGVPTVYDVPDALRAMEGRPPKKVASALRHPELVSALCSGLDQLGLYDLYALAEAWGPQVGEAVVPLTPQGCAQRARLVTELRRRAEQILAAWTEAKVQWKAEQVGVDGRTLAAAARAWQVPMINGELLPAPESLAARYPNRVGRCAAAVAFSRYSAAHRSPCPQEAFFEPLALLVAVGEAISRESWTQGDTSKSLRGYVGMEIPQERAPVLDSAFTVPRWWPVFNAWGASGRREAAAIPTAWRLSDAEGDVVVWALCSAAVRLAVAATMPTSAMRRAPGAAPFGWDEHVASALPAWETGARHLWGLMQSTRDVSRRTEFPGLLFPGAARESWPWMSEPADMVDSVPGAEELV
jgi:hypothetical protein